MPLDGRQRAGTAALVRGEVSRTNSESEMGMKIEKERRDVIVVDEEQDVGILLGQPGADGFVTGEDRGPNGVVLFVRIEREADSRRMGRGDRANDGGHDVEGIASGPLRAARHPVRISARIGTS